MKSQRSVSAPVATRKMENVFVVAVNQRGIVRKDIVEFMKNVVSLLILNLLSIGRWNAQIQHQGKKHYLGTFQTKEEAAMQYDRYALKYHGNHAYLNFSHSAQEQTEDMEEEGQKNENEQVEQQEQPQEQPQENEQDEQDEQQKEPAEKKDDNQMMVEPVNVEAPADISDENMISLLMGIRNGACSRENHINQINQPVQPVQPIQPLQPVQPYSLPLPMVNKQSMNERQDIHLSVPSTRMPLSSFPPAASSYPQMYSYQPPLSSNIPIPVNPILPNTDTIPVVLTSGLPPTLCCLQCSFPV